MFILKKLLTPFLLPPGIFILFLAILGYRAWRRKTRGLCATLGCLALALWIVSSAPASFWLTRPLETGYRMSPIPKTDVIIMLGGGVYSKSIDMSGIGAPAEGTLERLVTAARLHRLTNAPILLSGGPVFADSGSSARIAARFLKDLGIGEQKLIVEDQSRDTYENAQFSARICGQKGFKHPVVVTSAMHMRRSLLSFKAAGLDVTPYPCPSTTWPGQIIPWTGYLPSHNRLNTTSDALHEWIGLFYYWLRY